MYIERSDNKPYFPTSSVSPQKNSDTSDQTPPHAKHLTESMVQTGAKGSKVNQFGPQVPQFHKE